MTARVPLEVRQSSAEEPVLRPADDAPATPQGEVPKRILVVEDHEVPRRGIRALLRNEPGREECGEAEDGVQAVTKAAELRPDLVLLDLTMPRAGGFSVAKHVSAGK